RTLAELMRHEHAALALAQRCSALPGQTPLFTALLNYRHSAPPDVQADAGPGPLAGVEHLGGEERSNYPLGLAVDDLGEGVWLTAQVSGGLDPARICGMTHRALEALVVALEEDPARAVGQLDVLCPEERHRLLVEWNATEATYPDRACVHELFEAQAAARPE